MDRRKLTLAAVAAFALCAMAYVPYRYRQRAALYEQRWSNLRNDPAEFDHYRADNQSLRTHAPHTDGRVVFLGASVTENMDLARYFPGAPFVNRGISGQLLWQELLRAPDDVFSLAPDAVVPEICATNFEPNAPSLEDTERYLAQLAESARARGIHPVFATVIPVSHRFAAHVAPFPIAARIAAMNRFIHGYANAHGDRVIDWAAALSDRDGYLPDGLTTDGLHPNDLGYARMADAIRTTLTPIASR